jgi:perosamine synthetase
VLVDVRAEDLCLDPALAEAAIGPRTRAIMHVSLNGREGSIERFAALARERGLVLIEDAAQSFGSRHAGRALGSFGALGSFSFSSPKIITTGQGGALVTDDDRLAERMRRIRDFGRATPGVDRHLTLGFNFKFTDVQAVIGLAQMRSLEDRLARKRAMFALYRRELDGVEPVRWLPTDLTDCAPWFIDVLVPDPDALAAHLRERGIGSRRFYPAVHTQAPFEEREPRPNAEHAARHGLWLPSSAFLDEATIRRVCGEIRRFYGRER